ERGEEPSPEMTLVLEHHFVLRREVAEERALGRPCRGGDVVDGDGVEPTIGEERDGDAGQVGAYELPPAFDERGACRRHVRSPRANAAAPRSKPGTMSPMARSASGTPAAPSRAKPPSRITASLNSASTS